ncbi:MAG: DUF2235 domain-containing protein [Sphingomicrobium sp.]
MTAPKTSAAKRRRVKPGAAQPPADKEAGNPGKNILLFSDGTGNSSGKLFKTNVWRTYEAVDLGLTKPAQPVQIAYYDNGVGTSKIKAVAWIAGIFGFGLQRNVRAIYQYVCRNYEPGDRIYCFGFSRGAYTIRLVAGILATHGIATYRNEQELKARTRDVIRAYQSKNVPNFVPLVTNANRSLRTDLVALKRALIGPHYATGDQGKSDASRLSKAGRWLGTRLVALDHALIGPRDVIQTDFGPVPISFIGVWDTVAAYGGPSVEITRAIDNFIYPLTMTDQSLSPQVQVARHALCLDDERDAFHPLLWDEWAWAEHARETHPDDPDAQREFEARMKQVWFAGVHSDVGGGYPDESLSYVSLAWMMEEATCHGVRFMFDARRRVRRVSNSLGPIHNSRGGFASYYRYQPRRIEGLFHKTAVGARTFNETRAYRDPVRGERKYPPLGFLLSCKVHESVVARIAKGTDDYAPIVLPPEFEVVPFNFHRGGGNPRLPKLIRDRLSNSRKRWGENRERVYDWVWWRRFAYFLTVFVTAALVLMPLYAQSESFPGTTDGQWIFGRLTSGAKMLPWFLQPWVRAFYSSPGLFIILVVLTGIGSAIGTGLERVIRSEMRRLWVRRCKGRRLEQVTKSPVEKFRSALRYQRAIQKIKWYILPWMVGILMLFGIGYVLWVVAVQLRLSWDEPELCHRSRTDPKTLPSEGEATFSARAMCNPTGMQARLGQPYAIELAVPTVPDNHGGVRPNWHDGMDNSWPYKIRYTTPEGFPASRLGGAGYIGAPMRRLIDVAYMQVIYEIRPRNRAEGQHLPVVVHALDFNIKDSSRRDCFIYRADFVANAQGELYLFANDAVGLFRLDRFYTGTHVGNEGTAQVYLHELHSLGAKPETSAALGPDPCRLAIPKPRPRSSILRWHPVSTAPIFVKPR